MHLLYTDRNGNLSLKQVLDSKTVPYAILSHRWRDDEVLFHDMAQHDLWAKVGYRKLQMCMQQAQKDGLQHCWVDTCCINKESSAELQEAINSMWTWYADSRVCYAYLDDVGVIESDEAAAAVVNLPRALDVPIVKSLSQIVLENGRILQGLYSAEWFTRGWTLQELLAPRKVVFYGRNWLPIGDRTSLAEHIYHITGVEDTFLQYRNMPVRAASIAQRMTWARERITTRAEDSAYCMMGLLDINMSLLYGERNKAFRRLQEEAIKSDPDVSILWWSWSHKMVRSLYSDDILASSPFDFHKAPVHYWPIEDAASLNLSAAYLEIAGTEVLPFPESNLCLAFLANYSHLKPNHQLVCLVLRRAQLDQNISYTVDYGCRFVSLTSTGLSDPMHQMAARRQGTIRIARRGKRAPPYPDCLISMVFDCDCLTQVAEHWPETWDSSTADFWHGSVDSRILQFAALCTSEDSQQRLNIALAVDSRQPTRPWLFVEDAGEDTLPNLANRALRRLMSSGVRSYFGKRIEGSRTRAYITMGQTNLLVQVLVVNTTSVERGHPHDYTIKIERASKAC